MKPFLTQPFRIELFGGLRVRHADYVVTRFTTQKTAGLLAYRAYFRKRNHTREALIARFWPDSTPSRGRNNLSVAICHLRQLLEPPGTASGAVLQADRFSLRLNPLAYTTDVADFEAALLQAKRANSDSERARHLTDAIHLYSDSLLPDYYDEDNWLTGEQVSLEQSLFQAFSDVIACCERLGDTDDAMKFARRAISIAPLREEGYLSLMRLHLAADRPEETLRVFEELESILERDANSRPSRAAFDLAKQARYRLVDRPEPPHLPKPLPAPKPPPHPTGTVTFLFTEIELTDLALNIKGLTAPLETKSPAYQAALALHQALVRKEIQRRKGFEANASDDGFIVAFARPSDALICAAGIQHEIFVQPWREPVVRLPVRIALYTGEVESEDRAYHGLTLHRGARLVTAAHGGQILCSETTAGLVRLDLEPGYRLKDLGIYRLRDVELPERVYQLDYPSMPVEVFPPLHAPRYHSGHLPIPLTRFFGREVELARLKALLADAKTRLVTLTGMGGTGKTRLALEAARQAEQTFDGAIWFVSLEEARDTLALTTALVKALRLALAPQQEPLQQVIQALSHQASLLVLDNFEQLVETGSAIVQTLLNRIPSLKLLITSRQRVNIEGERVLEVPPLPTPNGDNHAPEQLTLFESVRLFIDRAQAKRPSFQITANNAPAVAALCDRLEGIPLAIELAAGLIPVLTPLQILAQLENRFDLLRNRRPGENNRHRSMRTTLDWSYDLLSPEAQQLLARLSVFAGGWTLQAAEAVCDEPVALDYLVLLQEHSLIRTTENEAGEYRYGMLATIREYAAEKLEERNETQQSYRRHLDFFLTLSETASPHLMGSDPAWIEGLEREQDNLRQALTQATGSVEGLRLGAALAAFWDIRGYYREGYKRLDDLLAAPQSQERTLERAAVLDGAGRLAYYLGDYSAAYVRLAQGLEIRRELDDRQGISESLNNLGLLARDQGDYALARTRFEEGLAISRELSYPLGITRHIANLGTVDWCQGDYVAASARLEEGLVGFRALGIRWGVAYVLGTLGLVRRAQGDYSAARTLFEQGLAGFRELGNNLGITWMRHNLGVGAYALEDYAFARKQFDENLTIQHKIGHKEGIATSQQFLGLVARAEGDFADARNLIEASLALRKELGDRQGIAWCLLYLGHVALDVQESTTARRHYGACLTLQREIGNKRGVIETLQAIAGLAANDGQSELAVQLWSAVERQREELRISWPPVQQKEFQRQIDLVREKLGAEAFATEWQAGQVQTLEAAIQIAFRATGSDNTE